MPFFKQLMIPWNFWISILFYCKILIFVHKRSPDIVRYQRTAETTGKHGIWEAYCFCDKSVNYGVIPRNSILALTGEGANIGHLPGRLNKKSLPWRAWANTKRLSGDFHGLKLTRTTKLRTGILYQSTNKPCFTILANLIFSGGKPEGKLLSADNLKAASRPTFP